MFDTNQSDHGDHWNTPQEISVAGSKSWVRNLLDEGALRVHYQPLIDITSGRVIAMEALARLQNGDKIMSPAGFLRNLTLDDRKLLLRLVVQQGLKDLRKFEQEGFLLDLTVNADAAVLKHEDTLTDLDQSLAASQISPSRLIIEVLESHEFRSMEDAKNLLLALKKDGIRVALDDLGAGHSSLHRMRELPVDIVKLDMGFVAGLDKRPDDLIYISAFQSLAEWMGLKLVIEGVETPEVLDALKVIGSSWVQGFGIARPMTADCMLSWLKAFRPEETVREPTTLLGAYAAHMAWYNALSKVTKQEPYIADVRLPWPSSLDLFFQKTNLKGTQLCRAYEELHRAVENRVSLAEIGHSSQKLRIAFSQALQKNSQCLHDTL